MLSPIALALAVTISQAGVALTVAPSCRDDGGDSSSFEFASNPWLNLYNFLVKQAKTKNGIEDDGLGAGGYVREDTAASRALSPAESAAWSSAVEFFARYVLPDRLGVDSLVLKINNVLARTAPNDTLGDALPAELRQVMQLAMPIYHSAWWPTHDRRNQEWIASIRAMLEESESCLLERAESVFRSRWPAAPIHVDATVYATWFGAYSTHHPTTITISANARGSQASYGLEVLLHETAHGMLDPLDSALAAEAARREKKLPREFSHFVLFYTAGALINELEPTYEAYADRFGIWRRSEQTRRYRELIRQEWQPYLSGTRTFAEAIAGLIQRL